MSSVMNAFIASTDKQDFISLVKKLNIFVVSGKWEDLELAQIFDKLMKQFDTIGSDSFLKISLSKENLEFMENLDCDISPAEIFEVLQKNKQKRNVGDNFKWIVNDNWKVDLVVTMNLRSLKNFFTLRLSGAAYFQIRWLAEEMVKITPSKYLKLILKENKIKDSL